MPRVEPMNGSARMAVYGLFKGLIPPFMIGTAAWGIGMILPVVGPPVTAILIGLIVGQIAGHRKEWASGLRFASKQILQISIVLLGAGMSLLQVAEIGRAGLPVMTGTIVACVAGGICFGRAMHVERHSRILVTYGTAICGASAIAAMSAVIGASGPAIAVSISVVVVYNVLAALLFPLWGQLLGLSQEGFGMWAGTAVNDTSSVVAAATVYGAAASSYAVVVKLTRTLAIVPLALFQAWFQNMRLPAGQHRTTVWYRLIPPFLIWFLVAAALQSIGVIPGSWSEHLRFLAHFGITVAMGAVGTSSSLTAVREAGWRPLALGGILWVLVASTSLALQWATGQI